MLVIQAVAVPSKVQAWRQHLWGCMGLPLNGGCVVLVALAGQCGGNAYWPGMVIITLRQGGFEAVHD